MSVIMLNSTGVDVSAWQATVNKIIKTKSGGSTVFETAQGIYSTRQLDTTREQGISEDGIFGWRTDALTKAIQQYVGVAVDGQVGPQTIAAVNAKWPGVYVVAPVTQNSITVSPSAVPNIAPPMVAKNSRAITGGGGSMPSPTTGLSKTTMLGGLLLAVAAFLMFRKKGR